MSLIDSCLVPYGMVPVLKNGFDNITTHAAISSKNCIIPKVYLKLFNTSPSLQLKCLGSQKETINDSKKSAHKAKVTLI